MKATIEWNELAEVKRRTDELGNETTTPRDIEGQLQRLCQILFNGPYTITISKTETPKNPENTLY